MVKIVWTKRTFGQFERAIRYIHEEHGLVYAKIVHSKIIGSIGQLETHPLLGAREPLLLHKKNEYRYLVVWSYKIIYRVEKEKIVISRLFHTSMNPKRLRGV